MVAIPRESVRQITDLLKHDCDIKGRFEIYSIHSKMNVNWAEIFKNIWSKVHWITCVVNRNDSLIVTEFNGSKSINYGFRNSENCASETPCSLYIWAFYRIGFVEIMVICHLNAFSLLK